MTTQFGSEEIREYFKRCAAVTASLDDDAATVLRMAEGILQAQRAGKKVLVGGNGGSCADAEHFVGELTCTYKSRTRRPFAAISLTSGASAMTAWSNDFGFESYFVRQIEALGQPGDIAFFITTGGGDRSTGASMNLVRAAEAARVRGMQVYALAGKTGGELAQTAHQFVKVKSFTTSHVQEAHIAILHAICEVLDVRADEMLNGAGSD